MQGKMKAILAILLISCAASYANAAEGVKDTPGGPPVGAPSDDGQDGDLPAPYLRPVPGGGGVYKNPYSNGPDPQYLGGQGPAPDNHSSMGGQHGGAGPGLPQTSQQAQAKSNNNSPQK